MRKVFLFLCFMFYVSQAHAEIFITSVFPNTDDDTNLEYIELYNSSSRPESLSGYTLSDVSGKTYTFGSGVFLPSKVFSSFFRPQTKIILNNTSETVFLKNQAGQQIESISYATSVKGEKITFLEKIQTFFLSDETYLWQPKIYYSDEVGVTPIPTQSGSVSKKSPEIQFVFQQPSYILPSENSLLDYMCDINKSDCNINFDLRPSFSPLFPEALYECEIDFGFLSTESKKCNPSTVTLREGGSKIRFQIFLKSDRSIVSIKTIHISNTKNTISIGENQESISPSSGTLIPTSILPNIVFALQQPSYVFWNADAGLSCDRNKSECKVNFDMSPSFPVGVKESDFFCEIESSLSLEKIESCNPGTLDVPKGEHGIVFRIFSKTDRILVSEKQVRISNLGSYLADEKPLSISKNFSAEDLISIRKPEILIQSGITEKQGKFFCTGKVCKINLEYQKRNEKERCLWDFGNGIYKESSLTRCNPGVIEYEGGIHPIKLRVYQSNNKTNYMESRLVFDFFPEEVPTVLESTFSGSIISDPIVRIGVQGNIGKNKTLSGSTLQCREKEFCSVNLIAETDIFEKKISKTIEYLWDFGNGEFFIGKNPKSIKFLIGNYFVTLKVYLDEILLGEDSMDIRVQEILKVQKVSKTPQETVIFTGSLSILSLLPNPVGSDIREWIEVKNTGEQSLSLDSCFFKNGKKKSKFPLGESLSSGDSRKIFKVFSSFSLGNTQGKIELFCGNILQDSIFWKDLTQEGDVVTREGIKRDISYDIGRNDFSSDTTYKTFVEKTGKLSVRKLKSGIKLSGETLAFQDVVIRSSQGKEYILQSDKNGIFEILIDRNISIGALSFTTLFSDTFQNTFSFSGKKEFIISQTDKNDFISKYIKKTRKKKTPKTPKGTSIEILPTIQKPVIDEQSLPYLTKMAFLFFLSFMTILGVFFLIPKNTSPFERVLLSFQVRQKVLLIL